VRPHPRGGVALRILYLNHNVAFSGGTFHRAFHFAGELAGRGHEVTLLSISPDRRAGFTERHEGGVRVVETPDVFWGRGRTGWDPTDALRRMWWLVGKKFDLVHGWDCRPVVIGPSLFARRLSRKIGCALFLDWCDWWGRGGTQSERPGGPARILYEPVETFFEEAFRRNADGTTVISEPLRERAASLGVPRERIWLLPQGCETVDWPADARDSARRQLGIASGAEVVLSVGVLLPRDGELLFEAMRIVAGENARAQLIVVGKHGTTIPRDLLERGIVKETGFVPAEILTQYMQACDVVAVPLADTLAGQARWPSRANRFLAAERAVVMTRVSDLAALLERERAGIITEPSPAAFAAGLLAALRLPDERASIVSRAKALAAGPLAWSKLAATLEGCYATVMNR